MHLVTADEMREMDRLTIESFGLPGRVLMENAGRGAARVLMDTYPDIRDQSVAVVAGRGNNGGGGFVIARYLAGAGINVTVYLLSESLRLTGDAAANFSLLSPLNIPVREIIDESDLAQAKADMARHHVFVDAILGTGINAEVRGLFKSAIHYINERHRPVLSVDIPSGLNADTGAPCGTCIRADHTVTFAFPKIGHVLLPGALYTGELHVVDIGIPPHIVENVPPRHHLLTKDDLRTLILPRPWDTHKGRTGHALVVAGSPGKTGAAALTSMAALRSGAGLVTLGIPERLNPILEILGPEVMTAQLMETATGAHTHLSFETIMTLLTGKRCLALGPGMGTEPDTVRLVHQLVTQCPVPMVLDADGLNAVAENPEILHHRKSEIILTPHPGEMARLADTTTKEVQENRIQTARSFAQKYQVHLVLKGARTLIAHPDGHIHVNPTGNPGMAAGGMGDVLTGIISGFLAQGYGPEASAQLGVFVHGLAADRVAAEKGSIGYIATDVMNALPPALAELAGEKAWEGSPAVPLPRMDPL